MIILFEFIQLKWIITNACLQQKLKYVTLNPYKNSNTEVAISWINKQSLSVATNKQFGNDSTTPQRDIVQF